MIHFARLSPKRWVYFGTEDEVSDLPLVEQFWFIEDGGHYRVGNGWRIRGFRDVAFHVGVAVRTSASSSAEALGGHEMEISPEEIGEWVHRGTTEEEKAVSGEDPSAAAEPVESGPDPVRGEQPDAVPAQPPPDLIWYH